MPLTEDDIEKNKEDKINWFVETQRMIARFNSHAKSMDSYRLPYDLTEHEAKNATENLNMLIILLDNFIDTIQKTDSIINKVRESFKYPIML